MDTYLTYDSPAYDLYEDDGITPNAATLVMQGHTGTLDTTCHSADDPNRTRVLYGETVAIGPDKSAAQINPYLTPDLTPLPADGYEAGPTLTGPIY